MDLVGLALIAAGLALAVMLMVAIATGRLRHGSGGIASLTVMHDFQPLDKQNATEVVIEQKAGKEWSAQESGEGNRTADPARAPGTSGEEPGAGGGRRRGGDDGNDFVLRPKGSPDRGKHTDES